MAMSNLVKFISQPVSPTMVVVSYDRLWICLVSLLILQLVHDVNLKLLIIM